MIERSLIIDDYCYTTEECCFKISFFVHVLLRRAFNAVLLACGVSGNLVEYLDPERVRNVCEYCYKPFTHLRFLSKHRDNYCYLNPRSMFYKTNALRPCICAGLVTVIVEIVSARGRNAIAAAKHFCSRKHKFLSFSNALLKPFKVIILSFSTHEFFLGNK